MPIQNGKKYYDGQFWVIIPPSRNPHKKRRKPVEETITVETPIEEVEQEDGADLDESVETVETEGEEESVLDESSPTSACNKNVVERMMTRKELFEELYKKYWNYKTRSKKKHIISDMRPYFDTYNKTKFYVEGQLYRKRRNYSCRKTRTERKMELQNYQHKFNYFITYTYDSKKHTEESFREKLLTSLQHLSSRKKWKYIGIWERGEKGERLHFHAITYIPDGTMPGMLIEVKKYSTKRKQWEITTENTYFNDLCGSTIFEELDSHGLKESLDYLLKYIEKTGDRLVYSKGLPQYVLCDVMDDDILCPHDPDSGKMILMPNHRCIVEGEILGRVSPELIEQMPKSN